MEADVTAGGIAPIVRAGDYRASLEALRDSLAASIDELSDRQVIHKAPLAKQLADVLGALAAMPAQGVSADSVETAEAEVAEILRLVQ